MQQKQLDNAEGDLMRAALNQRDEMDMNARMWERNEKRNFYNDFQQNLSQKQQLEKYKNMNDKQAEREMIDNDNKAAEAYEKVRG